MAPAEIQKRQAGAGDVEEELVFYTAVGKKVLQVAGEEVGNADGLHFFARWASSRARQTSRFSSK